MWEGDPWETKEESSPKFQITLLPIFVDDWNWTVNGAHPLESEKEYVADGAGLPIIGFCWSIW